MVHKMPVLGLTLQKKNKILTVLTIIPLWVLGWVKGHMNTYSLCCVKY